MFWGKTVGNDCSSQLEKYIFSELKLWGGGKIMEGTLAKATTLSSGGSH